MVAAAVVVEVLQRAREELHLAADSRESRHHQIQEREVVHMDWAAAAGQQQPVVADPTNSCCSHLLVAVVGFVVAVGVVVDVVPNCCQTSRLDP